MTFRSLLREVNKRADHIERQRLKISLKEVQRDDAADSKIANDPKNRILKIIQQAEELWHNYEQQPGITIHVNGHSEHYLLSQPQFEDWLRNEYFTLYAASISPGALSDAMDTVKAICKYKGVKYRTWSRIGEADGKIYIDLANDDWEIVEVSSQSWKITTADNIKFIRPSDALPQCTPLAGGTIDQLKPLLNVEGDDQFTLLVGFILKCFDPQSPYPILILSGEQGSGKTEMSQMLVSLVSPTNTPIRSLHGSERDLLLSSKYTQLFAIDNLSGLTNAQSDWLCRLSTGAGFSSRKLFSNDEQSTIAVSRPLILNGINEVLGRADLLDRAVVIHVPQLSSERRKTTLNLWRDFNAAKPEILGAICDGLVSALANRHAVQLSRKPRMIDFAEFITAAEQGFGWPNETFLDAYVASIAETANDSVELDSLAQIVMSVMNDYQVKELSAQGWVQWLKEETWYKPNRSLIPLHPNKFSEQLMRSTPLLRKQGFLVERIKSNGSRSIRITNTHKPVPQFTN